MACHKNTNFRDLNKREELNFLLYGLLDIWPISIGYW